MGPLAAVIQQNFSLQPPALSFPMQRQGKQAGAAGVAGKRNRAVSPTHHRPHSSGQGAAKGSGTLALGTASLMP